MSKRIVLVRMDGVGDALVLAPLVSALRDAGHHLGAVLGTGNRDIFAPQTFERVHVLERIPWPQHGSTPESYARVLDEMRAASYDVALVVSEEPEGYRLAREAQVATRIGFHNGLEKPLKTVWSWTHLTRAVQRPASAQREWRHEVETVFSLGFGFHAETTPTREIDRLRGIVVGGEVEQHGSVVLQVTRKLAGLGVESQRLCDALREVGNSVPLLAVAAPAEADFARALGAECGFDVEVAATTDRWKRLVAGASAVVTPDSGAAHLAGMTGVGCVDLFPDGPQVAHALQRWYPWASPRVWAIAVTPRIAGQFAAQLVSGIEYVRAHVVAEAAG